MYVITEIKKYLNYEFSLDTCIENINKSYNVTPDYIRNLILQYRDDIISLSDIENKLYPHVI